MARSGRGRASLRGAALAALLAPQGMALSQTVPAPAPVQVAPVQVAPLPAPGAAPQPGGAAGASAPSPGAQVPAVPGPAVPVPSVPAPANAPPAASASADLIAPGPADPSDPREVTVEGRPVAIASGRANWDEGFKVLRTEQDRVRRLLAEAGLATRGRPLTLFLETDDNSFRYEVMIQLAAEPTGNPPGELRFARSPSGRAMRVVHKAAYEEIEGTFEAITIFLDSKNLEAKDQFLEEYVNEVGDPADAELEVNVYVFLK